MKILLGLVVAALLGGSAYIIRDECRLRSISAGMSYEEVVERLGPPNSVEAPIGVPQMRLGAVDPCEESAVKEITYRRTSWRRSLVLLLDRSDHVKCVRRPVHIAIVHR